MSKTERWVTETLELSDPTRFRRMRRKTAGNCNRWEVSLFCAEYLGTWLPTYRQRKTALKASRDGVRMRGPKKSPPRFIVWTNGGWSANTAAWDLHIIDALEQAKAQELEFLLKNWGQL